MSRDPAATRARILDAAAVEFAAEGFHGARYERIAAGARANKERIYAYFGSKAKLFAAVLEARLPLLAEAHVLEDPHRIGDYVGELFDFYDQHPELTRLLLWEALHFGPAELLPGEETRAGHYRHRREELGAVLGGPDDGASAGHVSFLLSSLVAWWFAAPQVARLHLDGDVHDAEVRWRHRRLVVEAAERLVTTHGLSGQ